MQAFGDRASVHHSAQSFSLTLSRFGRKCDANFGFNFRNSSGISGHVFPGVGFDGGDAELARLGVYAHGCNNAGGQAQGAEIGRREGLSFAHVVRGGVGVNHGAALGMGVGAAQLAQIGSREFGHKGIKYPPKFR